MALKIFHTVNSGLCFREGNTTLFVDALHQGRSMGFSPTPNTVCEQMLTHRGLFQGEVCFALTHLHPDHFDPKLMRRFLDEYPAAKVFGPPNTAKGVQRIELSDKAERVEFGRFSLIAFQTDHDGKKYIGYPHCSLWLHIAERQYLICGDARLDSETAEHMTSVCKNRPDAVFANVYQLSASSGKAFLSKIQPKRIFLYHLPMPEDDIYHYWQTARHLVERTTWPENWPQIEILEPMREIPQAASNAETVK